MHQQSPVSIPSINIYRSTPVRVPSSTLHILSPLHPATPNHKKLHRRSRRSEVRSTQRRCRLHPSRWVHRPRQLPPRKSPALASLLSAYTLSSFSISPSRYGQPNDQGSKHHHLVIGDPKHCGIQSGEYNPNSPQWYRQPPTLVSNTWSFASFNN
jgi:hypothetical protein